MDCLKECQKIIEHGATACILCPKEDKLAHILSQVKPTCPNSSIPIVCDKAKHNCIPCLVGREAFFRFLDNKPEMIWAESGRRVLHPGVQTEVETALADHAREMQAERNAFSYLTQDEGG